MVIGNAHFIQRYSRKYITIPRFITEQPAPTLSSDLVNVKTPSVITGPKMTFTIIIGTAR